MQPQEVTETASQGLTAPTNTNPVALMVLGMHRSGTSALTRVLSLSGYALPATLMDAAADNTEGFWESRPIAEFNDRILAELGSAWDDPFAFDAHRGRSALFSRFIPEATRLIASEFPRDRSIVIKDPRITVLTELWATALKANGLQPLPIICVRHPLDVAASLAKRNGMPVNRSCLIWLSYQLAAERATRNGPRAFVLMDDLMSDWRASLDRIEDSLGIILERRDPEAELQIERALKPELVHHRSAEQAARAARAVPDWASGAYTWFEAMARGEPVDQAYLDRATEEYTAQRKWFGPILADMNTRAAEAKAAHQEEIAALEARLLDAVSRYEAELASGKAQILSLEKLRSEGADRIAALQADLETAAGQEKRLEDAQRALQAQLETARAAALALEKQLLETRRTHEAQLRAAKAETLALEQQVRSAQHKLAVAGDLQAKTVTGYEGAIKARESEIFAQLSHAQNVINDLEADLQRHRQLVRQRTVALDALSLQHHAVLSSTTWRATRPLRALGSKMPGVSHAVRNVLLTLSGRTAVALPGGTTAPEPVQAPPSDSPQTPVPELVPPRAAPAAPQAVFDAEPVARFIEAETGEPGLAHAWRTHCQTFPLPYDPASGEKPKVVLEDAQAAEWIERCKKACNKLGLVTGQPDATIIVPVYNQLPFTLSAIASIYAQRTQYTYEILLADDGSSDQTRTLRDGDLPRVRLVRHEKNLGFLRNCNAAAKQAKGRVIVLLNNDTVALPGWLDGLVRSIDSDPDVGFVGSRLLFPDGKLQEAGGLVWQDGSAWNYGRGQDPRDPAYSYAREVDYVSGASIAVPADLWAQLGGFDAETYDVAYYEDTDLAFRVREAGRKVLYQPRSTLVHFEGVSSGTDTSKGVKQYQVANGQRFFERWKETLETHLPNGVKPEQECERKIRKRILVIDSVTPTPDKDAGSLVMMEMLRAFQKDGWRVSFVPEDNFAYLADATPTLQQEGMEAIYWPYYRSVEDVLTRRGAEFDIVLISRVSVAAKHLTAVRRLAPHARVIFNTVDLHFLREAREAEISGDAERLRHSERTKVAELGAATSSDLVIVHSTVEQEILSREAPSAKVFVFPWVAEARKQPADLKGRDRVLFIGGFRHPPNVDAVNWLVADIWPLVRSAVPSATLRIIGPDAPDSFYAFDGKNGVQLVGWVPELEPELDRARLTVAPLRFGAGIKGKVISSISNGVPVVCTPVAAEGMGVEDGREVAIAADAAGMAEAIIRMLTDDAEWKSLSAAGAAFVDANYSQAAALERVREMIRIAGE